MPKSAKHIKTHTLLYTLDCRMRAADTPFACVSAHRMQNIVQYFCVECFFSSLLSSYYWRTQIRYMTVGQWEIFLDIQHVYRAQIHEFMSPRYLNSVYVNFWLLNDMVSNTNVVPICLFVFDMILRRMMRDTVWMNTNAASKQIHTTGGSMYFSHIVWKRAPQCRVHLYTCALTHSNVHI